MHHSERVVDLPIGVTLGVADIKQQLRRFHHSIQIDEELGRDQSLRDRDVLVRIQVAAHDAHCVVGPLQCVVDTRMLHRLDHVSVGRLSDGFEKKIDLLVPGRPQFPESGGLTLNRHRIPLAKRHRLVAPCEDVAVVGLERGDQQSESNRIRPVTGLAIVQLSAADQHFTPVTDLLLGLHPDVFDDGIADVELTGLTDDPQGAERLSIDGIKQSTGVVDDRGLPPGIPPVRLFVGLHGLFLVSEFIEYLGEHRPGQIGPGRHLGRGPGGIPRLDQFGSRTVRLPALAQRGRPSPVVPGRGQVSVRLVEIVRLAEIDQRLGGVPVAIVDRCLEAELEEGGIRFHRIPADVSLQCIGGGVRLGHDPPGFVGTFGQSRAIEPSRDDFLLAGQGAHRDVEIRLRLVRGQLLLLDLHPHPIDRTGVAADVADRSQQRTVGLELQRPVDHLVRPLVLAEHRQGLGVGTKHPVVVRGSVCQRSLEDHPGLLVLSLANHRVCRPDDAERFIRDLVRIELVAPHEHSQSILQRTHLLVVDLQARRK